MTTKRDHSDNTHLNHGVTRREAVGLMGVGGVAAAAFALVGCTPKGAPTENHSTTSETSEKNSDENKTTVPTEYVETDIVVVGAGGGGLTAALSAGYFGSESIIVLEKSVAVGGNTLLSHGSISNPVPPDYARADLTPELQKYIEDVIQGGPINESEKRYWDQFIAEYEDWQKNGDPTKCFGSALWISIDYARKDEGLVETQLALYERVPEYINWVLEQTGAKLSVNYGGSGYPWPNSTALEGAERGEGWINGLQGAIESKNYPVEIKVSTPATSLITDRDGNVVGVNAVKPDGGRLAVFAKRGVILASGGFTASHEMLQQYNVSLPYYWMAEALTDGSAALTGDGIRMSQAIGGSVGSMNIIQCLTQCDAVTGAENTLIGDRLRTLLRVNHEGKRFKAEDASRNEMTRAILALPEMEALQISDANNSLVVDGVNAFGVPIATLESLGSLFVADTIEELGEAFGADSATFAQTVKNFNKYCDEYSDPELGNTLVAPNCKLVDPPFYAYRIAPATHITYGGVTTDENLRALKYDRETPIEGLYVIGDCRELTGGCDISMPDGYVVGKHLMNDITPIDRTEAMASAKEAEAEQAVLDAEAAAAAAETVSYKDGSYQGTGSGMGGDITVSLNVTGGIITVTDISPNKETVGVGGYEAIEDGTYIQLVEDAQSANFDVISGATITSNAIQTAVAEALKGAKG
ncbi:MAG: FAD-binding protein [Raoultibacter sp.]